MSQPTPRRPSVSSLASVLIRRDPVLGRPRERVVVARPSPLVRVLIVTALGLTLLFTAGLLTLAPGIAGLVTSLRRDRAARDAHDRADLPAANVLLEAALWRREVARRPLAAANLHLARCQLLASTKRWQELDETVTSIGLTSPGDLLAATRLLHAEALAALARPGEAGAVLHAIDGRLLEPGAREHAAELAARLWLMGR